MNLVHKITAQINALTISIDEKQQLEESLATLKEKFLQKEEALTKAIKELEEKQVIISLVNEELTKQKAEVERKNIKLKAQKKTIEENSANLQQYIDELEKSNKNLEEFSYIASHDLKSPLRTISSFAQLLQRHCSDQINAEAEEFLGFIISGVQHMNDVVSDLLEFSRSGSKGKGLQEVNMEDIVTLVKVNLNTNILENNASVIVNSALPTLIVNKSDMIQLFQNLIENSIKFRSEEAPVICISAEESTPGVWEFLVSDNGIGIDEKFQEKAFMPFQRLNYKDRPGTGMGLAICKKIVKIYDGTIRYMSKPDGGTTFVFIIPQIDLIKNKQLVEKAMAGSF